MIQLYPLSLCIGAIKCHAKSRLAKILSKGQSLGITYAARKDVDRRSRYGCLGVWATVN